MPSNAEAHPFPSPDDIQSPAFRQALDAVPAGLVMVDPSGAIAFVNAAAERMFLYERNECQGQRIETLVPSAHRAAHSELAANFLATPSARPMGVGRDVNALRKDGTEFPVEIGLGLLQTSEGPWVIASLVDLTERKRLEKKVEESHQRVQALWEAASEGLITVDETGAIEMANKATERIFGYERSELIGQTLEILVPEMQREAHAKHREHFAAEPALRTMGMAGALFGRRKNGAVFPVKVGLNGARIGGRTVFIGFIADLTETRRLEEQSEALGNLVDLQQQLSMSSRKRRHPRIMTP